MLLRNWIQATFTLNSAGLQGPNGQHDLHACEGKEDKLTADISQKKNSSEDIDLSEDFCNMFGTSHNLDEVTLFVDFCCTMLHFCQPQDCIGVNNWVLCHT